MNQENRSGLGRLTGAVTEKVFDVIDPDILLDQIDVNALLDRIDVDRLLDRIDIERVLDRVDLDRMLARADVAALVQRSGVPEIVAESTGRFAGSALDAVRRQLLTMDVVTARVIDRVFGRKRRAWAHAPAGLRPVEPRLDRHDRLDLTGRYAGWLSRSVGLTVDVWLLIITGTLLLAGADYLGQKLFQEEITADMNNWWWVVAAVLGCFFYVFLSLEIAGRTPGGALAGTRVVAWDGSPIGPKASFVRTIVLPLSILSIIGVLLVVVQRDRRALHDLMSRTAVVADWAPRPVLAPHALGISMLPAPIS